MAASLEPVQAHRPAQPWRRAAPALRVTLLIGGLLTWLWCLEPWWATWLVRRGWHEPRWLWWRDGAVGGSLLLAPAVALLAGVLLVAVAVSLRARKATRVVVAGVLAALTLPVSLASLGAGLPADAYFASRHQGFEQLATMVDSGRWSPGGSYYGSPLPGDLGVLSVDGAASGTADGAVFVPRWLGIPDDAGGFWYSPTHSPEGLDMYGMECRAPVDLGDGWWSCGMAAG